MKNHVTVILDETGSMETIRDDTIGQLPIGRHLQIIMTKRLDQEALFGVAHGNRRSTIATAQQRVATVQAEATFQILGLLRVAFVAALHQHRADALLKERGLVSGRLRRGWFRCGSWTVVGI